MAEMTIKGAVQNTRNNITDADGYALPPLAANLKEGQIAVNTCETDPCIFFKTSEGKIVKIVSEEKLTKALTEILGNSAAELDTLRELIAQFEGTSGDILPMITDLVRRVDEAESAINTKADKSALNTTNTNLSNHTGNTSNPHGVTYLQVGALAVGGTAADSNKLGNRNSEQFGWQENNWKEVDLNTLTDKTYFGKLYAAKNAPFDSHAFASFGAITHVMQFNGFEGQLKYRTINVDKISAWFSMWHSGNSNNWASDWTAKNLKAINGHFKGTAPTNLIVEREGSDDNNSITFKAANLESYLGVTKGVLKFGTNLDLNTHGKVVYHAGNSNSYSVNWSANQLYLNGGIYANAWTTNKQVINQVGSDTNKALYIGNHTVNNIKLEAISYDNVFVKDSNGKIWNAGNSNKADVDWACKNLTVEGFIKRKSSHPFILFNATNLEDKWDYAMTDGAFYPVTNKFAIGTAANPWGSVHCGNVYFNELYSNDLHFGSIHKTNKILTLGTTATGLDKINFECGGGLYANLTNTGFSVNNNITAGNTIFAGGSIVSGSDFVLDSRNSNQNIVFKDTLITEGRQEHLIIRTSSNMVANEFWSPQNKPFWFVNDMGVGIDKPTEKLDVNGNIKVRGEINYINDNSATLLRTRRSDNTMINTITTDGFNLILGTNNLTRLFISSGGNIGIGNYSQAKQPSQALDVTGNGLFSGNVTAKGDIIAKKSGAVTFSTSDAAAGATRLNDLIDVKLPTNLADKMVLAYDPAQVNSDGSKGGYTFMPSAGTGTGTVSSAEITSLPDHNHNDIGYVSASDERLKENIVPLTGALNILLHFKPKQYTWNAEGNRLGLNDPRAYGLIAQEAAELKDIVDIVRPMNTSEEYLGVDYVKIVPILIAGVQEQHKEIIALNQKLKTIQARANKAYGNETNNADRIVQLEAEIAELKMLIKK